MRWLPRPASLPPRAGGFVTTQFVLAVAFSLLLFVMLCNAIVYQYGRGVVRRSLLGGPIGAHVSLRCALVAGQVRATASGYLPSWLPLVPDWPVELSATAVKEPFSAPTT